MKAFRPDVSERLICRILRVSRSSLSHRPTGSPQKSKIFEASLVAAIKKIIHDQPTWGYRRIWATLRYKQGFPINRKRVYRVLRDKGWFCNQRTRTPRPRVQARTSVTHSLNTRWAIDVTHFPCGRDGLAHMVGVIDCCNREIVGYEISVRSRANEAERALEAACIKRFGTLRPEGVTPVIRSDNGLIFQSRRFREACRFYRLGQEFITPYTPQQNGVIERFFRSLKEECVWQRNFASFDEAKKTVTAWVNWYNQERPHQSLGFRAPYEFQQQQLVA